MGKGKTDPESAAAMEVVRMEDLNETLAAAVKKKQGLLVARLYEAAGKIKATNFFSTQAYLLMLAQLKHLKESKEYKELGLTWPQVCEGVGLKWRTVDDHLAKIKDYKDDFLTAAVNFLGFDFNKIKYLGEAISTGAVKIKDGAIHFNGEAIPYDEEHREDVAALIEGLVHESEEAKGEAKAQKRVVTLKQKHIDKLEKALSKFEGRAAERELSPEEDAFLTQMDNLRIGFDGYMFKVEPERMEDLGEDATPIMLAEYLTTLWHMRIRIKAAYDTAVEMFGADLIEEEERWMPPGKKKQ